MNKKALLLCVLTALALIGSGCGSESVDGLDEDIITRNFYVFDSIKDELCGHLLFEDLGNPGLYHNKFVWVENLPMEYQEDLLPVTVSFRCSETDGCKSNYPYTEKKCGNYPIINLITIQKR